MLGPVLTVALERTVAKIGGATVTDPFFDVIDLTTRRAHRTTDVLTAVDHQLERFSGGLVEQPALAPEVGDHTLTVDHHSADVAGERGADDVVTVDGHSVLGLAVLPQQVLIDPGPPALGLLAGGPDQ